MVPRPGVAGDRMHGLDALRATALLLGVVLHSTLPFVLPPGLWAVGTTSPKPALGWLVYYLHSFRLEVFFLLAGFFGALIVERRGARAYLRDRATRILLVFVTFVVPLKIVLSAVWIGGGQKTGWLQLPPEYATLPLWVLSLGSQFAKPWPEIQLTHLWFLYYLSIIVALFMTLRAVVVASSGSRVWRPAAHCSAICRAALVSPAGPVWLAVVVTPMIAMMQGPDVDTPDNTVYWQWRVLALYGSFFALGWWLNTERTVLAAFSKRWRVYAFAGLAASVIGAIGVGVRLQSGTWVTAHEAVMRWTSSTGTALTMTLSVCGWIGGFLRVFDRPSSRVRYVADASYWIYIVHLPVVAALQVWWATSGMPWWIEVPLVNLVAFPLLLLSYRIFVRHTWIGAWINVDRRNGPAASSSV